METLKIFDLYETDNVVVTDPGLKRVINLKPKLILKSHGRRKGNFSQIKVNLVERLANLIAVPGHRGKKHKIMTNRSSGKFTKNMDIILLGFGGLLAGLMIGIGLNKMIPTVHRHWTDSKDRHRCEWYYFPSNKCKGAVHIRDEGKHGFRG